MAPLTLRELVSSQLKLEDPQLNVSTYKLALLIRTVSYFMGNSFKPVPRSVSKLSENHKNWEIRSMILVTAIETLIAPWRVSRTMFNDWLGSPSN